MHADLYICRSTITVSINIIAQGIFDLLPFFLFNSWVFKLSFDPKYNDDLTRELFLKFKADTYFKKSVYTVLENKYLV